MFTTMFSVSTTVKGGAGYTLWRVDVGGVIGKSIGNCRPGR